MTRIFSMIAVIMLSTTLSAQSTQGTRVLIKTSYGNMVIKLYNDTPKHRDNFIKLVNEGYYDGQLFHRVIQDFMIQGGDPNSRNASKGEMLGIGGPGYTIPAEIRSNHFHKKGALAAARKGDAVNPEKASSGSQFYIVEGQVMTEQNFQAYVSSGKHAPFTPAEAQDIYDHWRNTPSGWRVYCFW